MNLSLPLHLSIHLFLSLFAGLIVWRIWKKPRLAVILGLIGGFLIDLDHFIDYYLVFGWHWNWHYFRDGYQFLKSGKIYVLFHGWEYVIILVLLVFLFKNKYIETILLALALGAFFHLITDVVVDDTPIKSYSIIYRIKHNFDIYYINSPENYEKYLKKRARVKFE
ncbi:MAG: hypothetical protein NTY33_03815 [Candidatus Moranbacteria bacterium]|nr:hypothetical protein [Candidatus Moranbacteria bacterium]